MATRIQLRRDTHANWNAVNPVLAAGELGLEIDSGLIKAGDGISQWNDLVYITGGEASGLIQVLVSDLNAIASRLAQLEDLVGSLSSVEGELFVVKP